MPSSDIREKVDIVEYTVIDYVVATYQITADNLDEAVKRVTEYEAVPNRRVVRIEDMEGNIEHERHWSLSGTNRYQPDIRG